jgi:hypothetical protein
LRVTRASTSGFARAITCYCASGRRHAESRLVSGEWVRSAIIGDVRRGTGILNNPVYRGEVVWGRSRWIRSPRDSAIRRCEVVEDADELVTQRNDRLRIVSDELWNAVHIIQSARTPRSEAIRAAKRRQGRGPALWLSSLLVCSECGSNYVQYGRTDYVCGGYHNGSRERRRRDLREYALRGSRLRCRCSPCVCDYTWRMVVEPS